MSVAPLYPSNPLEHLPLGSNSITLYFSVLLCEMKIQTAPTSSGAVHSLIQQVLAEGLLGARHCSRLRLGERTNKETARPLL